MDGGDHFKQIRESFPGEVIQDRFIPNRKISHCRGSIEDDIEMLENDENNSNQPEN
jgi:hypothetical protein